ncbi:MAG: cbb3-type cytochrome c oxidase subunit I [Gemmatimonadales bacterium]
MERYTTGFLRASLLWLVAGVSTGVTMAIHPAWAAYRTAHLHMLLLGFVTMMIAGVAYHVFPRFAATPLHSPRLARIHLVIANLGVAGMAAGFVWRLYAPTVGGIVLAIGASCSATGAYLLAWNLWRTLDSAALPITRLVARAT